MNDQSTRPDQRWVAIAAILIAVGALFLLSEVFDFRIGSVFWPLFILIPGVGLLIVAFGRSDANPGLASPGAILTTLGLIFIYQNSTDRWESWAYIWALLPLSVGLALMAAGTRNKDESMARGGANTARVFAIIFVAGLVFFELLIFDRGGASGYLLPIGLIAAGGVMLWLHYRRGGDIPWIDKFAPRKGTPPAPATASAPPVAPPATAPTPAARATPPRTASTPPPAAPSDEGPFPEDELPHEPAPDSPFPTDEQSPEAPPEAPKPRRRTTTRTRKPRSSTSTSRRGT